MPTVTMKQIAKIAGVSTMTVSRALKDHPHIALATRERIKRLAATLGYVPHPYISALMSGLARANNQPLVNLAVLHFDTFAQTQAHMFYQGIVRQSRALGYTPECFRYEPDKIAPARLRDILMSRGIRGIVVMPSPKGFASIDFDFNGFAAATLGQTIVNPPLARVASDSYMGTLQVMEELAHRGYTRIGMVTTRRINRLSRFLYSAAAMAYHVHVSPKIHLAEHQTEDAPLSTASIGRLKRWIQDEKLDCIVCPIFDCPLYDILRRQGFDIPGKLGYVHLPVYPSPHVSCMVQMGENMGAKAVDVVTAMINRNEFVAPALPQVVSIPMRWHEGLTAPFLSGRPQEKKTKSIY